MLPRNSLVYLTSSILFLSAFSRFTHGRYTPRYHAYQEYHQPNDDETRSQIIPFVDALLGTLLLSRRTRLISAIVVDFFMIFGLVVQVIAGKRFEIDVAMVVMATGAVIQAWTPR